MPWVTWGLIGLNGLVFLRELSLPPERLEQFVATWGMIPAQVVSDPTARWTLITCMFLHGGWTHVLGNMWTLYLFGDNVEDRMGSGRFLLFYLLCGIIASLSHILIDPWSEVPTIGASGAIAGVLGAYFVLFPTARIITLVPVFFIPLIIEIPAIFFIGIWFVSQLLSGTLALIGPELYAGVAWWAHIGGFIAGLALLPIFRKSRRQYGRFYADEYWPW
ncbi:MAG: rhomboid family intramembrane serine protease [Gemmataceae bacterium]|nr:rhomboid family intramembrane serine protease [Gemmata sp.]MDW8196192.1 rhomboid family intramembrane serine protease [Gemmataceae bacterium]